MAKRDEKNLDKFRNQVCVICGRGPKSDPCHIRSRGAGGCDSDFNLVSMCRAHHREQHDTGWQRFILKYDKIKLELEQKGWEWEEICGRFVMYDPR